MVEVDDSLCSGLISETSSAEPREPFQRLTTSARGLRCEVVATYVAAISVAWTWRVRSLRQT